MSQVEVVMPKMGESVHEATIIKWVKSVGDMVAMDETILEIATDKVDSELPSPVAGKLLKTLFNAGDKVLVGKVIAIIDTDVESKTLTISHSAKENSESFPEIPQPRYETLEASYPVLSQPQHIAAQTITISKDRFYSPLVRNIAKTHSINKEELNNISGSGANGRVNKHDILSYITKKSEMLVTKSAEQAIVNEIKPQVQEPVSKPVISISGNVEIIEMDRMRKLIAEHMVMSKHTSPHVTSFVEADVTNIVNWRNKTKNEFEKREGEKLTFTPVFVEAVVKALKDFPLINVSVDNTRIIVKKYIHIGIATALPSGNLIVPVIKHADRLNLYGLTKTINDLASRARKNRLKPDETQDGTFTISNVGTFGNVMGTPIINQPQAAILAVGAIQKKPAVIETPEGDTIGIRQMMFLSLSYDHRVVDGALGGSFLRKIADYLEHFDVNRSIL